VPESTVIFNFCMSPPTRLGCLLVAVSDATNLLHQKGRGLRRPNPVRNPVFGDHSRVSRTRSFTESPGTATTTAILYSSTQERLTPPANGQTEKKQLAPETTRRSGRERSTIRSIVVANLCSWLAPCLVLDASLRCVLIACFVLSLICIACFARTKGKADNSFLFSFKNIMATEQDEQKKRRRTRMLRRRRQVLQPHQQPQYERTSTTTTTTTTTTAAVVVLVAVVVVAVVALLPRCGEAAAAAASFFGGGGIAVPATTRRRVVLPGSSRGGGNKGSCDGAAVLAARRDNGVLFLRSSSSSRSRGGGGDDDDDDNNNNSRSILEDSSGHVNRELAERIWNWEQEHRNQQNLPRLDFSVRSGLRLVDRTARELLAANDDDDGNGDDRTGGGSGAENGPYSDLVQDGLTALLDAMSHYEGNDAEEFERFARRHIRRELSRSLERDASAPFVRPHVLPKSVRSVLKRAKQVARSLHEAEGRPPSLARVAGELNVPAERLQDYLNLVSRGRRSGDRRQGQSSRSLSVESTVEIMHPLLDDALPSYRDQESWELRQGLLLDNGRTVERDQLVEDFLDESVSREGDDDSWIQEQEQIAGALKDMIPDDEATSSAMDQDDLALADLIRDDLSQFLVQTLEPKELQVIRLTFGLDAVGDDKSGKKKQNRRGTSAAKSTSMSRREIAEAAGITPEEVSLLLARGIQKLRTSYANRYVDNSDVKERSGDGGGDDEEQLPTIDSV